MANIYFLGSRPDIIRRSDQLDRDLTRCTSLQRLEQLIDTEGFIFNISDLAKAMFKICMFFQHTINAKRIFDRKLVPLFYKLYSDLPPSSVPYEKIIKAVATIVNNPHPLIASVISKLKEYKNTSFTNPAEVFWALAKLNQSDPILIKQLIEDIMFLVDNMDGKDLGIVAWSLYKLNLIDQNKKLVCAMDRRAKSISRTLVPQNRCFLLRLFIKSIDRANFHCIQSLLKDCKNHLLEFENRHLCMLAYSIKYLGEQENHKDTCLTILDLATKRFNLLPFREIANFANFASTINSPVLASRYLLKVEEFFLKKPDCFDSYALCDLTFAFSTFYTSNTKFTLEMSKLIAQTQSNFSLITLYTQFTRLASIGLVDEKLFTVLIARLSKNESGLLAPDLCNLILLFVKNLSSVSKETFLPQIINQVTMLMHMSSDLDLHSKMKAVIFVNILVHVYKQKFDKKVMDTIESYTIEVERSTKQSSSSLHQTVSSSLNRLKVAHTNEVFINGYWVDILVGDEYIIEVNGPTHYNSHKARTDSLIKRRLLRTLGYRIYYIKHDSIDECDSNKKLDKYIQNRILDLHAGIIDACKKYPEKRKIDS